MNRLDARHILEAALVCTLQPLTVRDMGLLFDGKIAPDTLKLLLQELRDAWNGRGVELVQVAGGWRFQSRPEMREFLDQLHPEKPPRYSRAVMETLAIIAYRQPVTRGDIEDIRGIAVNALVLKQLEDRGWIETIGHRETVGRPGLLATTRQFLDDMGVASLDKLSLAGQATNHDGPGSAAGSLQQLSLLEEDTARVVEKPSTPNEKSELTSVSTFESTLPAIDLANAATNPAPNN